MRESLLLLGLAALCTAALGDEAGLVPAKLVRARDGLGNVLAKLDRGDPVRIAYFGGSITAASGWRVKTLEWFRRTWPDAEVAETNAAIGGTGSDLGVFRCGRDVLDPRPDLVFVEFAVNDGGAPPEQIRRTMEGIVRQVWRADPDTDICFVYTLHVGMAADYARGLCPRSTSAHERIAERYGIPSVDVALRISELEREGKLVYQVAGGEAAPGGKIAFSNDGVHPLDAGHEIYAEVVAEAVSGMRAGARPGAHELGEPLDPDNWEDARLVDVEPWMLEGDWQRLDPGQGLGKAFNDRLPAIWHASRPGDTISFRFRGTMCRIYDLLGPDGGKAVVTVDGEERGERDRFDWYCTYHRLACFSVGDSLEDAPHAVEIAVAAGQPDREPVLKRVRDEPGFDPARYDGTNLWVGYVMLRGELLRE